MPTGPTPRQLARSENIDRIKRLALAQLSVAGASELSLRAIARELNLVSSAIYRYYASRDELITALIIDAYDDLADHLEAAGLRSVRKAPRRRWVDICHAVREWALTQPHRFALIYGSAIPGYQAPPDTIGAAGRVVRAFCMPVVEARPAPDAVHVGRVLARQLVSTRGALELDVLPEVMLLLLGAFARVIGLLTLELNGHFVGGFEPADALFDALVAREADALGA
ncbi:MAG: TetR/AcrR family transcriptional regulator [Nocardioides sp.]|nr:TetR/AcrR family transcriptional regulator [Nocardioides sp.]